MEHLLAREDLCRFLAACFCQPCTEFVEERLFDSIVDTARVLGPELAGRAERLRQAFFADDLETLLVDYTRLFLGPSEPLARPYGCYWLTGQTTVMQEPTLAVLALYREAGFDFDEAAMDVPDHVAVELEFLYLLAFKHHRAQEAGDIDAMAEVEALRERFLLQHLGSWIARFAGAVKDGAQTRFYRELAEFAPDVVRAAVAVH